MPQAAESSEREVPVQPGPSGNPSSAELFEDRPWRRGFWSLIATQFQGAFSANAFRYLLTYMILGMAWTREREDKSIAMVGLLFSMPFVLFSMAGGFLADRFSKRHVTLATKVVELVAMVLAVVALQTRLLSFQFAVLFLVATQAALFGPSKYGLLPEILPPKWLSWGNGVIELGTFLAVIGGTIAGGWLSETFPHREGFVGGILVVLALAGIGLSLGISKVPAAAPQKKFRVNFLADLFAQIEIMRGDRPLFLAALGNTYFWFLGALYLPTVIVYGKDLLHLQPTRNSLLDVALALGIGIGSVVAGYLSGNKIEYGLVPLGSFGMTAMAAVVGIFPHSFASAAFVFFCLGFFAGFFVVPVNTLLQHRPAADAKGGILAAANLLTFVGVAAASGLYFLLTAVGHLDARGVFLATSIITLFGTIYVLYLLPDWFLRLLLWFTVHTVYRVRVLGRDNVPEKGGALFVSNHMSFVDVLLLMASTDRPIRFLMLKDIYDRRFMKPFARIMKAIPVSSELRPRDMIVSLRTASDAIRNGEIVCIFAEGQITRTGQMLPFRRGLERIMKGVDAPIVPVNLHGVWGSIFSFERNRFLWKLPQRLPYPVTVSFGKWLPATATAAEVRRSVQELQTTAFITDPETRTTLDREFVRCARHHPLHFAIGDARVPKMRFGGMLVKSIYVARRLRSIWKDQKMVGILLPPSVGGTLVNIAATLLGKVTVNLNYTASNETIASCARQCNLQTVVTSKAFLERFPKMEIPGKTILLEDALAQPQTAEKLAALLFAWLLPYRLLKRMLSAPLLTADDLVTVIFSSGSTGEPKGVMLSHYNVFSNIRQMAQVFLLRTDDRFLGILPFFHSFGFTATLWLPATYAVGVVFHANPLDATVISELAGKYRATFLIATPTFLQAYMRRCSPEDFGSLRFVIVGAEKLLDRVALAFEDIFGIRPIEGYGCTECSPVVAVNTRDFRAPGIHQVGARRGTVGHPLPGISVRLVDSESLEPIHGNGPGMLQVKGPNVMKGYLGQPDKSAEVLNDGWYTTGDIVSIEDGGFLVITDRLSRFSKIGGEMVPHIKIEDKLHELIEASEQVFAVSSVPDEKRGERLVVLHTLPLDKLDPVLERLAHSDLPALWKPRPNQFFYVESLPYLGTGKLDLGTLKSRAAQLSEEVAV